MSATAPRKSAVTTGLPRRVKLALIELGGVVLMVVGVIVVLRGNVYGLLVVVVGTDVIARPAARRLPRAGALVDVLLRWKVGAGP